MPHFAEIGHTNKNKKTPFAKKIELWGQPMEGSTSGSHSLILSISNLIAIYRTTCNEIWEIAKNMTTRCTPLWL